MELNVRCGMVRKSASVYLILVLWCASAPNRWSWKRNFKIIIKLSFLPPLEIYGYALFITTTTYFHESISFL